MTVAELKKLLKDQDDDAIVVLSHDAEGNGYSKAYASETMHFYDGEVYIMSLTDEDRKAGFGEDDLCPYPEKVEKSFVLWPE